MYAAGCDMKITLAQINTTVGDVDGNVAHVLGTLPAAVAAGSDLVIFPEMCVSGYPPRDLVERPSFIARCATALDHLVSASKDFPSLGFVVGLPVPSNRGGGTGIANASALVSDGHVLSLQHKMLLPTYDVFDEARYFDPGGGISPVAFKGKSLGISICEDAWNDPALFQHRRYAVEPISELARGKAGLIVNISASPFTVGKAAIRLELGQSHARRHGVPFVMVNSIGGNDELIFDGCSYCVDGAGNVLSALPFCEEAVETIDLDGAMVVEREPVSQVESIWRALVLGVRDYFGKCGFSSAVLGLSGGIDSAVTLAIAVEAIGADNVRAIAMPSPHSSAGSLVDARKLAGNLDVALDVIPIGDVMKSYDDALAPSFATSGPDVTEENIQARIRGNLLMAYSNKFGALVLSTGNKSELAVGYCTLYGDMSGGLAVISDVPKTTVYRIAEFVNRNGERIPRRIIDKPPSAELRPDQKDTDTLPPYEILDRILDLHIERALPVSEIVAQGFDETTVRWVASAIRRSEYKRRQAAPGLKVTSKAFGVGRRYPVAARYED